MCIGYYELLNFIIKVFVLSIFFLKKILEEYVENGSKGNCFWFILCS